MRPVGGGSRGIDRRTGSQPDALPFEVMGIHVLMEGPRALLQVAARSLDLPPSRPSPTQASSVRVRISRQEDPAPIPTGSEAGPCARVEVSGSRLHLRCDGVSGVADAVRGRARVRVADSVLADEAFLGRNVLDTLLLFLVTARDRQPVHAAGVLLGGGAWVLAAASGTGKSTLAFAAHRAGLTVLSDDAVYLQTRPRLRVWGLRRPVALPADAAAFFPELRGLTPLRRPDGREKVLAPLGGAVPAGGWSAPPAGLCLLTRDGGSTGGAERLDPEAAVAALVSSLQPGFDRFAATLGAPLLALARRGAWRLALPPDPSAAVRLLTALS